MTNTIPQKTTDQRRQANGTTLKHWRDLLPWDGSPSRGDKVLLALIFGVPAFYLATMPIRPFLIAEAPVLLEFVVGSKGAIGAAAAYASVGQIPLWLVVVAGVIGMAKFDWLFWLAGRRWGERVLHSFTQAPRQQKWRERLQSMPAWALSLLIIVARVPGMPGGLIWILAGLNRMRLATFLILDLIGVCLIVAVVTAAGYLSGERGIDVIQMIDTYALWISLGLVVVITMWQGRRTAQNSRT